MLCPARLAQMVEAPKFHYPYIMLGQVVLVLMVISTLSAKVLPEDACKDFVGDDPSLLWRFDECIAVWMAWSKTVVPETCQTLREPIRQVAGDLQRAGSACFVKSCTPMDGAGSSAMRDIQTQLMAEEVGCKWVLPEWGRPMLGKNGEVLYCHEKMVKPRDVTIALIGQPETFNAVCSLTDWIGFFRYPQQSVHLPLHGTAKVLQLDVKPEKSPGVSYHGKRKEIEAAEMERRDRELLGSIDVENRDWNYLVLQLGRTSSPCYVVNPELWDDLRRSTIRRVLNARRIHFHQSRPGNERPTPQCASATGKLNFGIHVRLGDRMHFNSVSLEDYLEKLDVFMDTVAEVTVEIGFDEPMFHIFSESQEPCPDRETLTFGEFPMLRLDAEEVLLCRRAKSPVQCPELRAGMPSCPPDRTGIFHVQDRALILHVGRDVENEMLCMIQMDGMMSGCSTFGQVAGLLGQGFKFFSLACDEENLGAQYKTLPLLAIAERGDKWIPVNGSWHDPVLFSRDMLKRQLRKIFLNSPI